MELTKIEMSGNEYQVDVSPRTGSFTIKNDAGDTLGHGDTLEQAKQRARTAIAKTKVQVAVPFLTRGGKQGVATSRNAKTRNILVTIEGRKDQINSTYRSKYFKQETPHEVLKRLAEINQKIAALHREERDLESEWTLDVGRAVDEAVERAGREAVGAAA